jgi:type II secretory pathway component PulF
MGTVSLRRLPRLSSAPPRRILLRNRFVPTLDEFIALNDQLAAALEAGVPLAVDLHRLDARPTQALERVNAVVARQVSRGISVEEAVAAVSQELPPQYRSLVQIWLRTGNADAVLDRSSRLGEALEEAHEGIRLALVYPLTVLCLALVGMAAFCLFVLPKLEGFRESMRLSVGEGMDVLNAIARSLPVWGIVAAAFILFAVWFIWRSARPNAASSSVGFWARLTGAATTDSEERTAAFADWLALLLSSGAPEEESLRLASEASGDPRLQAGARSLDGALLEVAATSGGSRRSWGFPPFLQWALRRPDAAQQAQALMVAADVYRDSARRSSKRAAVVVPIVASAMIGGGAVLLYGLSLFVPLTEMLRGIAAMH